MTVVVVPIYFYLDLCEEDSCPCGYQCISYGFGIDCEVNSENHNLEDCNSETSTSPTSISTLSTLKTVNDLCEPGLYGVNCEESVCDDHICENGGSCVITINGTADCDCDKGYGGLYCEIDERTCNDLDDARPWESWVLVCEHGFCQDGVCECYDSYAGKACESTCFGHGQTNAAGECDCEEGYVGTQCEFENCDLDNGKCLNGGTCYDTNPDDWQDGVNPFICVCPTFYRGQYCETYFCIDENDCENGGVCTEEGEGCDCPEGYYGMQCQFEN